MGPNVPPLGAVPSVGFDIRRSPFSLRYFVLLPTSHQSLLTVVRGQ